MQKNYVVIDQGVEMPLNPAIVSLIYKYVYAVRRTAPDASHQNSPAELPHRCIEEPIRYLTEENQVTLNILKYALIQYVKVHGMVPHGES